MVYNKELNNDAIVWHHSDIPDDLWVIGTENIAVEMANFITLPISVDQTFDFGAYDITPFTYHSKCNLINKSEIHIITDGEPALIAACLKRFSKCSLLRCTRHLKANCKNILVGIDIKRNRKDAILDIVFNEHRFVEAEDKQDLKEKMKDVITLLSEMEKQCLPQNESLNNNILFSSYIESREKKVLGNLTRSSRRKAYHISGSQVPPRVYTNQSETVNSMLSAKKVSLGYSKKDDIAKSHFVKYVWKSTVDHQSLEIERALTNQSAEYRLSEEAQYLAIPTEV